MGVRTVNGRRFHHLTRTSDLTLGSQATWSTVRDDRGDERCVGLLPPLWPRQVAVLPQQILNPCVVVLLWLGVWWLPCSRRLTSRRVHSYPRMLSSKLSWEGEPQHATYRRGDWVVSFSGCPMYLGWPACNQMLQRYHRQSVVVADEAG